MYGGCWSTYIHKRPNIGNALRGLFTGTQSEKDGSNKARVLSHMSLGVISTKHKPRLLIGYRPTSHRYRSRPTTHNLNENKTNKPHS